MLDNDPTAAERLAAELGKNSAFAREAGVYIDTLPAGLPLLPEGWEQRLISHQAGRVTARCLEIHDLIVTKLAAGRLKDYEFVAAVVQAKLARTETVQKRIESFVEPRTQAVLLARLRVALESSEPLF